jgi:hypothetical protein
MGIADSDAGAKRKRAITRRQVTALDGAKSGTTDHLRMGMTTRLPGMGQACGSAE